MSCSSSEPVSSSDNDAGVVCPICDVLVPVPDGVANWAAHANGRRHKNKVVGPRVGLEFCNDCNTYVPRANHDDHERGRSHRMALGNQARALSTGGVPPDVDSAMLAILSFVIADPANKQTLVAFIASIP